MRYIFAAVLLASVARPVLAEPDTTLLRVQIDRPTEYRVHLRGELEARFGPEVKLPPEMGPSVPASFDVTAVLRLSPAQAEGGQQAFRLAVNSLTASADILNHRFELEGDRRHFDVRRDGKSMIGQADSFALSALAALPAMVFGQDVLTITYDPRGQILGAALAGIAKAFAGEAGAEPFKGLNLAQLPPIFPLDPVRLFEGWHGEAPFEYPTLGLSGQADYYFRLKGFKTVSGASCAWVGGRARISVHQALTPSSGVPFSIPGVPDLQGKLPSLQGTGTAEVTGNLYVEPIQRQLMGGDFSLQMETSLEGGTGTPLGRIRAGLSIDVTRIP